jgi:enterobactin synthetase component D
VLKRAFKLVVLLASGDTGLDVVTATRTHAPWNVDNASAVAVELSPPTRGAHGGLRWTARLPAQMSNAREPRVVTYLAGRYCAAEALKGAGVRDGTVVDFGDDRAPVWPVGYVGSITHTSSFAGAVVAPLNPIVGIGIDTENLLSAEQVDDVRQTVAPEYHNINFVGLDADGEKNAHVVSCLFSAKESIYKCLHPLVREFFEFSDVSVTTVDHLTGTVHTVLNRPLGSFPRHWPFHVRFVLSDGRVHTSAVLYASQIPSATGLTSGTRE